MRRLIVPSSLLSLAASLCILAMLGPAGAAGSVPRVVCPQLSGAIIPPCCPVPTNGTNGASDAVPCCPQSGSVCCGSTACCTAGTCCAQSVCCATACMPGALTIASSPDPSTAGRKVVISGGLTSNPPPSGATVVLWRELSGQSTFHQLAQTTTDSAGQYKFTLKRGTVNADQRWYVTVTADNLQSPTLDQRVNALVGLAGLHSVVVGHAMLLRGHVTPSHAGQIVLVEQRRGSLWRVIARPRLGRASNYRVMHRFTRSGTVSLRTVLPGDARNDRSGSSTLTVTVKP